MAPFGTCPKPDLFLEGHLGTAVSASPKAGDGATPLPTPTPAPSAAPAGNADGQAVCLTAACRQDAALLGSPYALAADPSGNVYIVDSENNLIRIMRP